MPHVIILAGGSIGGKLTFLRSRCSSPALIPVNTRPLAAYLIDFYAAQPGYRVHLVVNADVADTVRAELGTPNGRYELKALHETTGVVHSLAQAAATLPDDDEVIVNLVTSVPTQIVAAGEVLVARESARANDWSGVVLGAAEPVFAFKSDPAAAPSQAFTGIFRCGVADLRAALATTTNPADLLAVVEQLQARRPMRYVPSEWIDCGHETHYYEAKARLLLSRSFNQIQVSLEDGVLRKTSDDTGKLARERDYVEMLPPAVGVYFPRILSSTVSLQAGVESVEMEYYGYPTVAEYFLYWELSADNWRRLFSRISYVLHRFRRFPHSISEQAFEAFYLDRTVQRVEQFLGSLDPLLRSVLEGDVVVNGRTCRPFAALTPALRQRIGRAYREADFYVMHGDLCFNNILYDVPSGIVRLIDPRGSFGEQCVGIHGDQKYDLAKLAHSAEYGYDFIVNGLYAMRHDGSRFSYSWALRECAPLVAQLSRDVAAELGYEHGDIELLTSLLFLSMCPLHADDQARQLVMYVHGLRLLNTALEG
jgi:hypothetical protein